MKRRIPIEKRLQMIIFQSNEIYTSLLYLFKCANTKILKYRLFETNRTDNNKISINFIIQYVLRGIRFIVSISL